MCPTARKVSAGLLAQHLQQPRSWPQLQRWDRVSGSEGHHHRGSSPHLHTRTARPGTEGISYNTTVAVGLHVSAGSFGLVVTSAGDKTTLEGRSSQRPSGPSAYSWEEHQLIHCATFCLFLSIALLPMCVFDDWPILHTQHPLR